MTSAADLIALQEIDLKRDARRALLADIEARLGETEELVAARERSTTAEADVDALRHRQHDLEGQVEDLDARIQPVEKKLYDGSVRNPRELTDLQKDVDAMKARRRVLDDEGLTLLDAVETANAAAKQAGDELQRLEAEWQADQADLIDQRTRTQVEATHLEGERDLWARSIDASTLGLYEHLRTSRAGRAVARVERSTCQGCRISLPSHLVQKMRTGMTLVQCPSCERILVSAEQ